MTEDGARRFIFWGAVRTGRGRQTLWSIPERRPLVRTDRMLVVATRAGLADLVERAVGVPNPPPLVEIQPLPLVRPKQTG